MRSFVVFHTVTRSFQNYMQADFENVFNSVFCTTTELGSPINNKHAIIAY